MMQEEKLKELADLMIKFGKDYKENRINENDFRKAINDIAIKERDVPYDDEATRYVSGSVGYNSLKRKVIYSDKKHFAATINTILPNRGLLSNKIIKNFAFDLFLNESKLNIKNLNKIHIRIAQYIKPTKKGKLPKDSDNNEKKGVIDGISKALNTNDTGDRISYSSTIKPLSEDEDHGYTELIVIPDEEIEKFFEEKKKEWKD